MRTEYLRLFGSGGSGRWVVVLVVVFGVGIGVVGAAVVGFLVVGGAGAGGGGGADLSTHFCSQYANLCVTPPGQLYLVQSPSLHSM